MDQALKKLCTFTDRITRGGHPAGPNLAIDIMLNNNPNMLRQVINEIRISGRRAVFLTVALPAICGGNLFGQEKLLSSGRERLVGEIHWNQWLKTPEGIKQEWFSRGINIFMNADFPFGNSSFSFSIGAGLASDNYYHNGRFTTDDSLGTLLVPISDSIKDYKNKLSVNYLEAPLELRFRSRADKRSRMFKVAVGIRGGLLVQNHTRYKGPGMLFGLEGSETKVKEYKLPNTAQFRFGATGRIGYGPYNIIVYYGLTGLFEESKGDELVPMSIGIAFNGL